MKYLGWIVAAIVATLWVATTLFAPDPEPPDLSVYEDSVRYAQARTEIAQAALQAATEQNSEDSARWELQREDAAARGYAAGVRAVELAQRADSAATDLSAVLEPEELALFYDFLAVEDSVHASQNDVIATQAAQIVIYADERASLLATISSHRAYEDALNGSLSAVSSLSREQYGALEAEQALRRRAEIQHNVTKAIAVGGAGKVCYDAGNDGNIGLAVGACAVALLVGIS